MDLTAKPVHTLVLDTGGVIKNEPSVSTLLARSEKLVTVPEVIGEIKDAATRSRVQNTLVPFLELRSPRPESVKFVTDFARRTGDLAVLSRVDVLIVALTYEIECERNGGDWRLRRAPGQKRVNGAPPKEEGADLVAQDENATGEQAVDDTERAKGPEVGSNGKEVSGTDESASQSQGECPEQSVASLDTAEMSESADVKQDADTASETPQGITSQLADMQISTPVDGPAIPKVDSAHNSADSQGDSDSEGWITPSNLKKKQAQDAGASTTEADEPKTMQVAVLTTDFAMQNVVLQINLNLLSPSLTRVKHLKTFVLRCHACFQVTKEMSKQFCPKCGQPTLIRVSCSTNANGEFKVHLKRNMQWNHRGERYSMPKPVHGAANGKVKGGGKGGWGNELLLAEDQKEYQRATWQEKKAKERSLMDEDYLPGILTGERKGGGGKVKIGAGRTVNSRKR